MTVAPRDTNLVWRSAGALTATETLPNKFIRGGTGIRGMSLQVLIPSKSGTSPTLVIDLKEKDASSGNIVRTHTLPQVIGTDTFPMLLSFDFVSDLEYYDVVLTVGGTTPSFGVVEVWVGPPSGRVSSALKAIAA